MAFYLKKTKLKGRTYLSIDESFYSHEKKGTAHKCYKSLGSVETWKKKGIEDPISHFQKEVDALNQVKANAGTRKICMLYRWKGEQSICFPEPGCHRQRFTICRI